VVGTIQATEVVKALLGLGEPLVGRLLTYDALGMRFREVKLRRDPNCPLCGTNPTIKDLSIHMNGAQACSTSENNHSARAETTSVSSARD
jgi:bacteriocin biosynthesis cyclodehydratase domain-containing protein